MRKIRAGLIRISEDLTISPGYSFEEFKGTKSYKNHISKEQHNELIKILNELIETIVIMRKDENDYVLVQNESEAREWFSFLKEHKDKEELKSLENEISNRFFFKFDVQIEDSELDNRRAELMKIYISKSNEFLK